MGKMPIYLSPAHVFKQKCSDKKMSDWNSSTKQDSKPWCNFAKHWVTPAVHSCEGFSTSIVLPRLSLQKQNTSVISSYAIMVIREKR